MAVIDWFSRYVLSWRLAVSLESDFCAEALGEALRRRRDRRPRIFNTDQGSQFTSGYDTPEGRHHPRHDSRPPGSRLLCTHHVCPAHRRDAEYVADTLLFAASILIGAGPLAARSTVPGNPARDDASSH